MTRRRELPPELSRLYVVKIPAIGREVGFSVDELGISRGAVRGTVWTLGKRIDELDRYCGRKGWPLRLVRSGAKIAGEGA